MSKKEFEKQDEEVMDMVNRAQGKNAPERGDTVKAYYHRQILWTALQVAGCILVAVLLVAVLLDPSILVHLVNAGVLACGMTVAVLIDRYLKRR